MSNKKKLGMGLALLLPPLNPPVIPAAESDTTARVRNCFERGLAEDQRNNDFEAYHWYRTVIDCHDQTAANHTEEEKTITSRAMNNAAVILAENGRIDPGRELLIRALELWPDNDTARANLENLKDG
jgi:hypothetical protein